MTIETAIARFRAALDADRFEFASVMQAQIAGTPRGDTIFGTRGDDVIRGGAGNDTIYGRPNITNPSTAVDYGDDRLIGGGGNDKLIGHAGDNRMGGGEGDNSFYPGGGANNLYLSGRNERLAGIEPDWSDPFDGRTLVHVDGSVNNVYGYGLTERWHIDVPDDRFINITKNVPGQVQATDTKHGTTYTLDFDYAADGSVEKLGAAALDGLFV